MSRIIKKFLIENTAIFKQKVFEWVQEFNNFTYLESNPEQNSVASIESVLAIGEHSSLKCNFNNSFSKLKSYQSNINDYIFGYLSYDLKNDVENLTSNNFDGIQFPDLYFFQPKKLIFISNDCVEFQYLKMEAKEIDNDFEKINTFNLTTTTNTKNAAIKLKKRLTKKQYLQKIETILKHVHRGDCYEVNFCQEFYAEKCNINPSIVFNKLNSLSKPPFAAFLKLNTHFLISASPERFLQKKGTTLISQPIKGTVKRAASSKKDLELIRYLETNAKDRAENIMIVDLVRNDLARIAEKGSVTVDELCKVYSFLQVHQLISTVSCKINSEQHPVDIIKNVFPMGSMTGAPKISAMKIIENLEETKRGLYSGAIGYIAPSGDFDFNVIIRSILYNASNNYLSYSVGGAITALSKPEKEYEECLLKGKALRKAILNSI